MKNFDFHHPSAMFRRYRLKKQKAEQNDRKMTSKWTKSNFVEGKSEKDRIVGMFKNPALVQNVFNRLISNNSLLDENIEEFTTLIFVNLMKCKKEKVISKNIDCIKKLMNSVMFHKVQNVSYNYFKTLFYMERFPKRLSRTFEIKFKENLSEDPVFQEQFKSKNEV